jgi:acyl dehydratase
VSGNLKMNNKPSVYLDDLVVGETFISGKHQLNQEQIVDFATQYDPQPFHLDPQAAESTPFRGLAASGWHTTAITMRLLVDSLPISDGIIGTGAEIEWPRPTRPSDCLQVTTKVVDIRHSRSKPDRGIVTLECLTKNQSDEICQRMVTKVFVMRRPV